MIEMRRSKIVYLLAIAGVILTSCVFTIIGRQENVTRYHQHLEEPGEKELGVCRVCGGENQYCTHLPIIQVETGGHKIPGAAIMGANGMRVGYETSDNGETEIKVSATITGEGKTYHHPEDKTDIRVSAMFRIRGNSSRYFKKCNYRLKLIDEKNPLMNVDVPLLGMNADDEWVLHGPYLDKTLMRNYLCMNLSAGVMGYAPDLRFCELFIDGEYKGVYLLMETIGEGAGKVDLTDYEEGDLMFSYITRLEPQHGLPGEPQNTKVLNDFASYSQKYEIGTKMELLYPGVRYQTEQVKKYVETDLSEIERKLYSREMEKNPDSCWEYLDLESFANYYILQEFLAVNDMFSASTYFYKDVRGKLHIGPVWDYNNALNNYILSMPEKEFILTQKGWYGQLMKSKRFVDYVVYRYRELRRGVMSQEYLENYVRDTKEWLGRAIERNFDVWGYTFDVTRLEIYERQRNGNGKSSDLKMLRELNPSSYEEAVEHMVTYMKNRGTWMDREIDSLYQYCHPSKNAANRYD